MEKRGFRSQECKKLATTRVTADRAGKPSQPAHIAPICITQADAMSHRSSTQRSLDNKPRVTTYGQLIASTGCVSTEQVVAPQRNQVLMPVTDMKTIA